jgi:hypothetical protein
MEVRSGKAEEIQDTGGKSASLNDPTKDKI